MMTFEMLSISLQGSIGILFFFTLWFFAFLLTYGVFVGQYREKKGYIMATAIMIIGIYYVIQCVAMELNWKDRYSFGKGLANAFVKIPAAFLIVIWIIYTCLGFYLLKQTIRWRKTHITNLSIKQAVDYLTVGICYYDESGRVLLKNLLIDELSVLVTGEPLANGNIFYDAITEGKSKEQEKLEALFDRKLLYLKDGRVFSVQQEETLEQIHLLMLFDISEEYEKTLELMRKKEKMQELEERLIIYNKEILQTIAKREVLSAKVKIHDEIGVTLLAIKNYILQGEYEKHEKEKQDILISLQQNVQFLLQESNVKIKDEYEKLCETAETLGVKVSLKGELPLEKLARKLVITATHECLTNAIRHAKGNRVYLEVRQDEKNIFVKITNDGEVPQEEIVEKGGLLSLRDLVQRNGGKMQISIVDRFMLLLEIPREEAYGI